MQHFAAAGTPLSSTQSYELSREVAYVIMLYLSLEDLGLPRNARLLPLVEQAFGHLDQWFVNRSADFIQTFYGWTNCTCFNDV